MAEHRRPTESICVKTSAKTAFKIELFPAEQWQKSAQGRFRLRVNRRWIDSPEGVPMYMDRAQIGTFVSKLGDKQTLSTVPPKPDLPPKTRVNVPNGKALAGVKLYDISWTITEPFLGYDGRWYVCANLYGVGGAMVPVDEIILKKKGPAQGRANHQTGER